MSSALGWLKTTASQLLPRQPPFLRAAIDQACRHLSGVVDDLQPVLVSALGDSTSETSGQQNEAPISEEQLLLTPEEESQILRCNQIIHARQDLAKPQNTANAERWAAKLWKVGARLILLPFAIHAVNIKAMSLTASAPADILRAKGVHACRRHVTGQGP